MCLWALQYLVCFCRIGVDSDREVDGEGELQPCCLSFYFCLRRPLLGAGPSLSVVVTAFALSSLLYDWYCDAGLCCKNCWSPVIL